MTCTVRESVVWSCDLKTRLMCPSGKAHGLLQRTVAIQETDSSDFWGWLAGVALGARVPRIAPDHPFAHEPPEHTSEPPADHHPSVRDPHKGEGAPGHSPCLPDAGALHGPSGTHDSTPVQGPRSADEAAPPGECERAVYDPLARAFYDAETGSLLADLAAWERASEDQRAKARARLAAVRRTEDLIARGLPRCKADAAAKEAGIARGVLGRWRRKVRGLPRGAHVIALLDARRPGRPSLIDAEMRETLEALLFGLGDHLTAVHAHRTLLARHGRAPKVQTVRAWLRRWRRENRRELLAVTNPDLDRSSHKPAGGDAADSVLRLNQLWELDSTPADVICADGKRYAIVAAIDIWSRQARVLVVPTSRATAISALLRRCILEWGVPEAVRTDEGKDYTSRHVLGVLADLEIEHRPCPSYTPEAKPFVERFLGTLTRDLFATLPGFTGHDVAQAQALRSRKSFSARRGEDDAAVYGAELTAEELQERCDTWCDAVYGRRPHGGLGGASPFARRASWPHPVRRVHDERALDSLLAEPAGGGWRTVRKAGIRLDNADYIAGELGPLVGERVRIRRDAADPDRIFVYREDGAFVCVAEEARPARRLSGRARTIGSQHCPRC